MPETGLSPAEKYLCSAYGAHISWANTENRTERTAPARKAFEERFEREVRESDPMGSYPRLRSPSVPNLSGKLISRSGARLGEGPPQAGCCVTQRESRPGGSTEAASKIHASGCTKSASPDDFDFDQRVVDRVDESLWRAVYNGHFCLATRCLRCGRWLTANASKRAHLGRVCAAKSGETK